jgi:hypothetical protein
MIFPPKNLFKLIAKFNLNLRITLSFFFLCVALLMIALVTFLATGVAISVKLVLITLAAFLLDRINRIDLILVVLIPKILPQVLSICFMSIL